MTFACKTLLGISLIAQTLLITSAACGQAASDLPRVEYYLAKELFGSGRTAGAAEGFEAALQRARRVGEQRWIDSIPPLVMLGECYYRQGSLAAALEQYDQALMIALSYPGWIDQLDVPPEQLPVLDKIPSGIDWFPKSTASQPVAIPPAVQISIDPTRAQADGQGGVVAPINLVTRVDATEVLRTQGLAMLRRYQILGPLAVHSPLAEPLRETFRRDPQQPAVWVQHAWRVLRGISQLAAPPPTDASGTLRSAVLLGNRFDFFMSPLALLTLGEIEARQGNFKAALSALQDAALLAAQYESHGELEQSLISLASYAAATGRIDLLEPLQQAASWSANRSGSAAAAALLGASELAVYAGELAVAERLSNQAGSGLRARDIDLPRAIAQLSYLKAMLGFAQNRTAIGIASLDAALQDMRGNAQSGAVVPTVFQAQLALNLLAAGNLAAGDAESVLGKILQEPGPWQWQTSPLETLASMTTASLPAFERHLELAAARQDPMALIQRMDRLQRQSFYEALPLGGRLLGWRQATTQTAPLSPEIDGIVNVARQRHPELQQAQERVQELTADLQQGPLPLDERQLGSESRKLFGELQAQSQLLENGLALQALMRNPLPRVLPPPVDQATLQTRLASQDTILSFAFAGQGIVGLIVSPSQVQTWQIDDAGPVLAKLQQLRIDLGLIRAANQAVVNAGAANAKWQLTITELRDLLLPDAVQEIAAQAKRLILIPNRQLWYLPFELFPLQDRGLPWLSAQRVVYLPNLGSLPLAFQQQQPVQRNLGIYGPLFSIDIELNRQLANDLTDSLSNASAIDMTQKVSAASPTWLKLCTNQLWTAYPIEKSGWDSVLMSFGKTKQLTFGSLLETPQRAPQSIVLAGLSTSLRAEQLGEGNELFLPVCSLLYSGGGTAVISRWPVGGRSTADILQRYLQERSTTASSLALRRAILARWPEDYLVAEEPVLLPSRRDAPPLTTGAHPLLWSAYMAVGDNVAAPAP